MKPAKTGTTDMPADHWVERYVPDALRPYFKLARIDRPIGTWLLLLPAWWSIVLASPGLHDPYETVTFFVLFGVGAIIMRGAGCTFNDIVDRDFDAQVARTRTRPVASGAIPVPRALIFLVLQLVAALGILLSFNDFTIALGAASLVLVFTYPLMKRITYWPQAFLGITFNWGALLGFAAVTGTLGAEALALYAGGFFWTLGYDTIYAHQDKEDDVRLGVRSSALRLGEKTRPYLFAFYGLAIAWLALAGYLAALAWPYFAGLALGLAQLFWQAGKVDLDSSIDCLVKFGSNRNFGWIVLAGLIAAQLAAPIKGTPYLIP
ncbi:MAG: 4-hydroxybenzoate octaprenyltransferase [Proteobacteria bacterium]|nr:4-hydroxybenzoate octaprenyltransferase [Pseudomonadota bacterium]